MSQLQWLSVPHVFLGGEWGWLSGLQQLQVLVVTCGTFMNDTPPSSLPWLEECSPEVFPPRLQVLGVSGVTAEQAVSWQVRSRLQQLVGSGCEVVVGSDLDEVCDPAMQLAGLPVGLQQVLA
jgi:hypothetical protein